MDDQICRLDVRSIATHYRDGSLSPIDVVDAFLERIERLNPSLNAFVLVTAEAARHAARRRGCAASERRHVPVFPMRP